MTIGKNTDASKLNGKSDWAEEADYDESGLPQAYETVPNKDGIKEVVTFKRNEAGKIVKTTRKIKVEVKVTAIPKAIAERKLWARFGNCAGAEPGPEQNVTIVGEEVSLEFPSKQAKKEEEEVTETAGGSRGVVCRNCGAKGLHLTQKCPYKGLKIPGQQEGTLGTEEVGSSAAGGSSLAKLAARMEGGRTSGREGAGGKYVPPNMRAGGADSSSMDRQSKDNSCLRVSNLSEDTTEDDIKGLFRRYGGVQRVYVAKDYVTQQTKGFAFVTFYDRADAEKAKAELHGFGLDHLVLNVEWARPSTREQG